MAFSGEAQVLTWQRVDMALTAPLGTAGPSPNAQMVFRQFKHWMAAHKQGPQLQFIPFNRTTNGSGDGNADTVICGAAGTLLAVYGKKSTGVVLSYLSISNHATAIAAQKEVLLAGTAAGVEVMAIYSNGLAFATGITLAAVTAYNGTTHSLTADSWDGFAIISA